MKKLSLTSVLMISSLATACTIEAPSRCENVVCETENGSGTCNEETGECEYDCDEGFSFVDTLSKCIGRACLDECYSDIVNGIENGVVGCKDDQCTYSCNAGYELDNDRCIFDKPVGKCTEPKCYSGLVWNCTNQEYETNSTKCESGVCKDGVSCADVVCDTGAKKCKEGQIFVCKNNSWNPDIVCEEGCGEAGLYCVEDPCNGLDCSIRNGSGICSNGECVYTCNNGYNLIGDLCLEPCNGEDCSIGKAIAFGHYDNLPIQWYVLTKDATNHRLMLLAIKEFDNRVYNSTYETIVWERSTIRSWLNGYGAGNNNPGNDYTKSNFLSNVFTSEERSRILKVGIENTDNPEFRTDAGNNTEDYVFLLSIAEVNSLLGTGDIVCEKIYCMNNWWLRSPGSDGYCAATVDEIGSISYSGYYTSSGYVSVRPALWIKY